MTIVLQAEWFIQMARNNDLPLKSEYQPMTLEELNSMAYTYNFGLSNKEH